MKKFIILPMFALCAMAANAQDFDSKPTVTIDNEQEDLHFTVGARFMADAAWYHNDYTPMQSGATIADARIRTSLTYQDWYFYADFGFAFTLLQTHRRSHVLQFQSVYFPHLQ